MDLVWTHFEQLGYVAGYKQKRRQCKLCGEQINDAARQARSHIKKCQQITLEQRRISLGQPTSISIDSSTMAIPASTSETVSMTKKQTIQSFIDRISKNK